MGKTINRGLQSSNRPLVGVSRWVQRVQEEIRTVAPFPSSILVSGPSGTGKELIARAIHASSPRADKPFIAVNCAAITGPLFESHMFGHLKGAFTGSDYAALGCFRAANEGTIFLDELGELEPDLQAKLLRVLQEGTVTPVGSHQEIPVDVRIVAATNRDLAGEVVAGRFREDLYYRLAVVSLQTLPLRERREDVELLCDYLLSSQSVKFGIPFKPLSTEALAKLQDHDWPGNVRELQNVLERAAMFAQGELIEAADVVLNPPTKRDPGQAIVSGDVKLADSESPISSDKLKGEWPTMEAIERRHIVATLEQTNHNQAATARLLGMDRSMLRRRIQKLGLDVFAVQPRSSSP